MPKLSRLALAVRGKCRTSLSAPQKQTFNPEDHFSYILHFQTSLFKFHNSTIDNRPLFASLTIRLQRANEAGGGAHKLEPKHALAQVAATGSFGNAFYSTAETQLDEVLKLIEEVDDNQYLAKLALYARERAFMKDMPAALLVALSTTVSFYTQFSI